ncbi:MAG: hypothetical protein AAF378_10635 [Cyanobacteria bacterium P01_A01_bin.84]
MPKLHIKNNDPDELVTQPTESIFLMVVKLNELDEVREAEMKKQREEQEAQMKSKKPNKRRLPYKGRR